MRIALPLVKETVNSKIVRIILFVLLMAAVAQIRIPLPFSPVPLTLQTLIIYLSLVWLKKASVYTQMLYIGLGVCGLPVFSNAGAGLAYLLGPTGGYLFGFFLASLLAVRLVKEVKSFLGLILSFTIAAIMIYSMGIFWLMFLYRLSFLSAVTIGLLPFIFSESIKIIAAALIVRRYNAH